MASDLLGNQLNMIVQELIDLNKLETRLVKSYFFPMIDVVNKITSIYLWKFDHNGQDIQVWYRDKKGKYSVKFRYFLAKSSKRSNSGDGVLGEPFWKKKLEYKNPSQDLCFPMEGMQQ